MRPLTTARVILLTAILAALASAGLLSKDLPAAKPEDVGMSSERLGRMSKAIHAYVDAGRTPGVVTLIARHGIFPTIPVVTHFIRHNPRALAPLHRALTRLLPIPGWCFLNLLTFRR